MGWDLNEWLVHNLWSVGFDHVVFYDDDSTDNTRCEPPPCMVKQAHVDTCCCTSVSDFGPVRQLNLCAHIVMLLQCL